MSERHRGFVTAFIGGVYGLGNCGGVEFARFEFTGDAALTDEPSGNGVDGFSLREAGFIEETEFAQPGEDAVDLAPGIRVGGKAVAQFEFRIVPGCQQLEGALQ